MVYVVDDDAELRRSLMFLLTTRRVLVTSYESGEEFFAALPGLSVAPIILDLRMPQMDGLQFLERLSKTSFDGPVILLSGHGEVNVAVKAIKLGAIDFLEKPVTASELELCLERAFAMLELKREQDDVRDCAVQLLSSLTPRQCEVLERLCEGRSNKQVAFDLALSPRTVEMHRANALRHLGVKSIAQVANLRNSIAARSDDNEL